MKIQKILLFIFISFLISTTNVSAATGMTADELRAEIARLSRVAETIRAQLIKYGNDPNTVSPSINNSNPNSGTGTVGNYTGAGNGCLQTNKQMKRRHSGGSVSTLQKFLVQQRVYSASLVTGYFGPATEAGVQAWQASHGIVSSGTPASTGYGKVGPSTLQAMHAGCQGGKYTGPSGSLIGNGISTKPKKPKGIQVEKYSLTLNPTRGIAPMTVTADFSITGSTCTSYLLDWGDGALPESYDSGKSGGCTALPIHITKTHIYNATGIHTVLFKTGKAPITKIKTVSNLDITIIGAPRTSY